MSKSFFFFFGVWVLYVMCMYVQVFMEQQASACMRKRSEEDGRCLLNLSLPYCVKNSPSEPGTRVGGQQAPTISLLPPP